MLTKPVTFPTKLPVIGLEPKLIGVLTTILPFAALYEIFANEPLLFSANIAVVLLLSPLIVKMLPARFVTVITFVCSS